MKNFALGFLFSLCICLVSYILWENHRHVPVLIQQVPVPVPVQSMPSSEQMNDPIAIYRKVLDNDRIQV
jgi:hypothetical protein